MITPQFPTLREIPVIQTPQLSASVENIFADDQMSSVASKTTTSHSAFSSFSKYLKLGTLYSVLFFTPIAGAYGINNALSHTTTAPLTSAVAAQTSAPQDYQQAVPASANTDATSSNDIEYELSLSNGFLQKAIKVSNSSSEQTVDEKNQVIQLLNQAMEAANRAIQLAPNDPRAYTSRGRVYLASAVVKPEMKALSDQDFAKAAELGSPNPSLAPSTQDPMELLPTQQAANGQQAMIAAPEEQANANVSGQEGANAHKGQVTLPSGSSEVFVPYSSVKSDTQLYVTADVNPENLTLYVKNKEEGVGFTVASTSAPASPVEITWWEIQ